MLHCLLMLTPEQIRAARALLNWSQAELADRSGVAAQSIKNIERGVTDPRLTTATTLKRTLESAGVQFVEPGINPAGNGVALRTSPRHVATQGEMQASADDARFQAAEAVDEALIGSDATAEQKAERRGALTDESEMIGQARGKGRGKPSPDK